MNKQRLLDALDCTIEDISEDRLVDILVDAYKASLARIKELEGENAHERETMHHERERMRGEYHRMRSDPLYCANGEYYFSVDGEKFGVVVQGFKMDAFKRKGNIDYRAQQLSVNEFNN